MFQARAKRTVFLEELDETWFLSLLTLCFWVESNIYGCFRKYWHPQIIHFNRVFHYKPSILGYLYFWKHPYRKSRKNIKFPPKSDWYFTVLHLQYNVSQQPSSVAWSGTSILQSLHIFWATLTPKNSAKMQSTSQCFVETWPPHASWPQDCMYPGAPKTELNYDEHKRPSLTPSKGITVNHGHSRAIHCAKA